MNLMKENKNDKSKTLPRKLVKQGAVMNQYLFTNKKFLVLHIVRASNYLLAKKIMREFFRSGYGTRGWTLAQTWENVVDGNDHVAFSVVPWQISNTRCNIID